MHDDTLEDTHLPAFPAKQIGSNHDAYPAIRSGGALKQMQDIQSHPFSAALLRADPTLSRSNRTVNLYCPICDFREASNDYPDLNWLFVVTPTASDDTLLSRTEKTANDKVMREIQAHWRVVHHKQRMPRPSRLTARAIPCKQCPTCRHHTPPHTLSVRFDTREALELKGLLHNSDDGEAEAVTQQVTLPSFYGPSMRGGYEILLCDVAGNELEYVKDIKTGGTREIHKWYISRPGEEFRVFLQVPSIPQALCPHPLCTYSRILFEETLELSVNGSSIGYTHVIECSRTSVVEFQGYAADRKWRRYHRFRFLSSVAPTPQSSSSSAAAAISNPSNESSRLSHLVSGREASDLGLIDVSMVRTYLGDPGVFPPDADSSSSDDDDDHKNADEAVDFVQPVATTTTAAFPAAKQSPIECVSNVATASTASASTASASTADATVGHDSQQASDALLCLATATAERSSVSALSDTSTSTATNVPTQQQPHPHLVPPPPVVFLKEDVKFWQFSATTVGTGACVGTDKSVHSVASIVRSSGLSRAKRKQPSTKSSSAHDKIRIISPNMVCPLGKREILDCTEDEDGASIHLRFVDEPFVRTTQITQPIQSPPCTLNCANDGYTQMELDSNSDESETNQPAVIVSPVISKYPTNPPAASQPTISHPGQPGQPGQPAAAAAVAANQSSTVMVSGNDISSSRRIIESLEHTVLRVKTETLDAQEAFVAAQERASRAEQELQAAHSALQAAAQLAASEREKREKVEANHDSLLCRICYSEPRTVLFPGCMHLVLCATCAIRQRDTRRECPICRGRISAHTWVPGVHL